MKFAAIIAVALPAIANAALTFNITQALAPGEFKKYKCLTTAKFNTFLPDCLHQCQIDAASQDGCAYDDYACHCIRYQQFSDIIEPCAFPPALGGHGTCSFAELGVARPIVQDMCNFFNATVYADYLLCPQKLSPLLTLGVIAHEKTVITV